MLGNVVVKLMAGTVVRNKGLQQFSKQEEWSSQVLDLNRFYQLSGDVYEANDSEYLQERSRIHGC